MPFRKYRELAQWGRYNTRIFKEVYANKLKKSLASYRREKYLEIDDKKARVYDIDELIAELDQRPNKAQFEHPYLAPPKLEVGPNLFTFLFSLIHYTKQRQLTFTMEVSHFRMGLIKPVAFLGRYAQNQSPKMFMLQPTPSKS